jgi:hypothetical protein
MNGQIKLVCKINNLTGNKLPSYLNSFQITNNQSVLMFDLGGDTTSICMIQLLTFAIILLELFLDNDI